MTREQSKAPTTRNTQKEKENKRTRVRARPQRLTPARTTSEGTDAKGRPHAVEPTSQVCHDFVVPLFGSTLTHLYYTWPTLSFLSCSFDSSRLHTVTGGDCTTGRVR